MAEAWSNNYSHDLLQTQECFMKRLDTMAMYMYTSRIEQEIWFQPDNYLSKYLPCAVAVTMALQFTSTQTSEASNGLISYQLTKGQSCLIVS